MRLSRRPKLGLGLVGLIGGMLAFLSVVPLGQAEETIALTANHSDAVTEIASQGTASASRPLRMQIYLAARNQAQLDELSDQLQDPTSPQYHHWLTPAQFAQRFGPTDEDVAEITQWLTAQGFTVTFASASQRRIAFTGDVGTAQAAFQVRMASSRDGKKFGNVDDPQVPASLAPKISHLAGLDNLHGNLWNTLVPNPPSILGPPSIPLFGPPDIQNFSDETPLLTASPTPFDGTGQCIAVSEGSDVDQASLTEFNTLFALPAFTQGVNFDSVFPDGSPGAPGSSGGSQPYGEALLDIEYAHGLAPGAEVVLYAANAGTLVPDPVQPLVDTVTAIVNDTTHNCKQVAISWAQCGEPSSFYTTLSGLFQQGAAEGESIFVATGDLGTAAPALGSCLVPPVPHKKNIEENAASPFVTAVGASMFPATYDGNGNDTSTIADTTQTVWDFSINIDNFFISKGASTGGYSKVFPIPSWQQKTRGITGKFRAVPDLVLGGGNIGGSLTEKLLKNNKAKIIGSDFHAPGFWECFDQGLVGGTGTPTGVVCSITGGTSIVPPQYSAIFAIINQKSGAVGGQGLINPNLYAMAKANLKNPKAVGLIDVLTKNNAYAPVPGLAAHKGFDLASGWGAVDINQFVNSYIAFVPTTAGVAP
jgi:subtilase family serine protease